MGEAAFPKVKAGSSEGGKHAEAEGPTVLSSGPSEQCSKNQRGGTSLVAQWLRLCTPSAGGPSSTPGLGTRSYMPQGRLIILHATTKTPHSQINNLRVFFFKKREINWFIKGGIQRKGKGGQTGEKGKKASGE